MQATIATCIDLFLLSFYFELVKASSQAISVENTFYRTTGLGTYSTLLMKKRGKNMVHGH